MRLMRRRRNDSLSPFDRSIFSLFDDDWFEEVAGSRGVEVTQTDTEVKVRAPVPGLNAEDIKVNIRGNRLIVQGETKEEDQRNEEEVVYSSSMQRSFNYVTTLPTSVDEESAKAEVENGIVTVTIPKAEVEKGNTIEVTAK